MKQAKPRLKGLIACAMGLSALAACSVGDLGGIRGSGVVKEEVRDAAGFTSITLTSIGDVHVRQAEKDSLVIRAEDNLLPLLESRVEGGTLKLSVAKDARIDPTKPVEFDVTVKNLQGLKVSGAGSVEASDIRAKNLLVELSGVGSVAVSGAADELALTLSGVGSYRGADFKTKRATVRSSGVGSAVVNASELLDASVSGVGSVEYVGSPQVRQSVSGVGSIKKL
jgi:hypothetical protein